MGIKEKDIGHPKYIQCISALIFLLLCFFITMIDPFSYLQVYTSHPKWDDCAVFSVLVVIAPFNCMISTPILLHSYGIYPYPVNST